jgi:hypothetical protein
MFFKSKKSSSNSSQADDFIMASLEGLQLQTGAHESLWGLGKSERWDVDLDTGKLTFTFSDKIVEAPINVIGTYDSLKGSFMWGWDHPSVPKNLQDAALKAKKWGEENSVPMFLQQIVECTEDDAWNFTAVATRLSEANGAYKGQAGTTFIYMTFGKTTMQKR